MNAGPELDLAVAKACGIVAWKVPTHVGFCVMRSKADTHCGSSQFDPSRRLDDAFLAAEKFGLFQNERCLSRDDNRDEWLVGIFGLCKGRDGTELYIDSVDKTPALAICAAIIKLAEKPS